MEREPQTYDELKAHYLAVKKRLGGVSGPTGLVPPSRINFVDDENWTVSAHASGQSILGINVANERKFRLMLQEVARMHNLDPAIVCGPSIKQNIVKVRHELFYRAKNELKLTYTEIGNFMNMRHSTIIHAVKSHQKRLAKNLVNS
jgi:hypothetical protein